MKPAVRFRALALAGLVVVGAVLLRVVLFPASSPAGKTPARRPNVLIIVTDDQRQGLNVMPATVKRFVDEGRRFPRASVTTPQCCPSRASILTGRFAHNHGVLSNVGMAQNLDQKTTLEYYLKQQGYRTAIFGKYLNGWGLHLNPPYFDEWVIGKSRTYYDGRYRVMRSLKTIPTYSTTYLQRKAVAFIRSAAKPANKPWFMFLAPFAPHNPFTPERKYAHAAVPPLHDNPAIEETDKSDKPRYVQQSHFTYRQRAGVYREQERTLLSVDNMVRAVFNTLSATGQDRDTLAFFISDNGLFYAEHGLWSKSAPYLQSFDVPMMMRWPDAGIGRSTDPREVANIDIAPTVLSATGYHGPLNAPLDGRSLLDASWKRNLMLNEFWHSKGDRTPTWAAIRNRDFIYTEYYDAQGKIMFREYYDLHTDKWQLDNLLRDGDPSNDPNVGMLHHKLALARRCRGTTGASACP